MTVWLDLSRVVVGLNLVDLAALGVVWVRNYLAFGARHTLLLLIFAAVLGLQNILWLYFYTLHGGFAGWYLAAGLGVQVGVFALCGLELVGLAVITSFTLR